MEVLVSRLLMVDVWSDLGRGWCRILEAPVLPRWLRLSPPRGVCNVERKLPVRTTFTV